MMTGGEESRSDCTSHVLNVPLLSDLETHQDFNTLVL